MPLVFFRTFHCSVWNLFLKAAQQPVRSINMKERALWKNHFRAEVFIVLRHCENRHFAFKDQRFSDCSNPRNQTQPRQRWSLTPVENLSKQTMWLFHLAEVWFFALIDINTHLILTNLLLNSKFVSRNSHDDCYCEY